ncbi:MAG: hypothetical protein K8R36_19885 [Planctomycetales bacterium]|nr:hypothetical protein [Planctomycetales bacterium]
MNSQPTPARRRFYPLRISLRELRLFTAPAVFALMLLCMFALFFARVVFYEDVASNTTADEANQRMVKAGSFVRVPEKATHVNFYARYHGGGADFDISESDFRAWCEERGWPLTEERSVPPNPPLYVRIGPDDVRHCYQFSNTTHRGGWIVMYDIDRQRAWMHLSPR